MKNNFLVLLLLICSMSIYAQVGIGTTSPEPTSILDISSTTQGMLAPRMTTAQRVAISTTSTSKGLLVFDIDEDVFYFYDGASWVPLEGAEKRNNYKLVKDITDLSAELAAGGGSTYLLSDNYTYEINGRITFDFPVNLNGANIIGADTGEDILENGTTGTFFIGTNGGRFVDLIIEGGGQQVFNISGGAGAGSLVGYSVLVKNASSLGTVSDLFAFFFNVLQVTTTDDGIDVSNITSFFLDKIFWTDSNTGTFLTLSGTFGNLQIANGRVVADAGETGIDVSADPTITVSASLAEVSFSGAGTLVNGYTTGTYPGYFFNLKWDVDCPGLLLENDNAATGDANLSFNTGTSATTTFGGDGIPTKLNGTTTSTNLFRFSRSGNNRIVYEGTKTRYFNVTASISFAGTSNNDVLVFYVAKGNSGDATATPILVTGTAREIGSNFDIGAVAVVGTVQLSTGDYVELWAERDTGGGNVFVASINMVVQ